MDTTGPTHACIVSAAGDLLAIGAQGTVDTAQDAADLQLMAAAPELFAFARAFVASGGRVADASERANLTLIASAAIAKATGGAQ